tara:strand:+ start:698 stop:1051 length:354 start_codon:yes stop_codon:yes gene_type:complete
MLHTPSPLIRRIQKLLKYQCPFEDNIKAKMDNWIDSEDLTTFYYGDITISICYYDNSFSVGKSPNSKTNPERRGHTVKELDDALKTLGYNYLFQPCDNEEDFFKTYPFWFPKLEEES